MIEEMRTQYPYLKRTLIPRGTYPNQPEPVRTLGIDTLLVCRADLDDDLVYRAPRRLLRHAPGDDASKPRSRARDADSAASGCGALLPPARAVTMSRNRRGSDARPACAETLRRGKPRATDHESRNVIAWGGWLTALLAVAVCLGIATLLGFGYRATREWQRSSELLIARDTEESADLLVTAVTRDMRGAHSRVLANRDWGELSLESLTDTSDQVATAFARYPVSGIVLQLGSATARMASCFSTARTGFPRGCRSRPRPNRYPVALVMNPPEAEALRTKVDGVQRRALPLCDVRHDARRTAVSDRRAARVCRPVAGDAALGHWLHCEPRLGPPVVFFGHPLAGRAHRHARQQPRHRGVRRRGTASLGTRRRRRALLSRSFPLLFLDPSVSMVALGANPAVRTWTIQHEPVDRLCAGGRRTGRRRGAPRRRRGRLDAGPRTDSRHPRGPCRRRADGDALGFRLIGDARAEDAAREHSRHGRHAGPPADRRRNRPRLRGAAHAGGASG